MHFSPEVIACGSLKYMQRIAAYICNNVKMLFSTVLKINTTSCSHISCNKVVFIRVTLLTCFGLPQPPSWMLYVSQKIAVAKCILFLLAMKGTYIEYTTV